MLHLSPLSQWDWLFLCSHCSRKVWRFQGLSSNTAETTGAGCPRPSREPWSWPQKWRTACWRSSHWTCPGMQEAFDRSKVKERKIVPEHCLVFSLLPVRVKSERSFEWHRSLGDSLEVSLDCWCSPGGNIYPGSIDRERKDIKILLL